MRVFLALMAGLIFIAISIAGNSDGSMDGQTAALSRLTVPPQARGEIMQGDILVE